MPPQTRRARLTVSADGVVVYLAGLADTVNMVRTFFHRLITVIIGYFISGYLRNVYCLSAPLPNFYRIPVFCHILLYPCLQQMCTITDTNVYFVTPPRQIFPVL